VTSDDSLPELDVQRSFGWGFVLIADSRAPDIPDLFGDGIVVATSTAVAVLVRHAQDVNAEGLDDEDEVPPFSVSVHVWTGRSTDVATIFDGVIAVPSGQLTVGDADRVDLLAIGPGRWRIQIVLAPEVHAENVGIWITRMSHRSQ
jgi:hypothetical protein